MATSRCFFTLLLLLITPCVRAQVSDTFADGDFTANPAWTGDSASWTIIGGALRSNGQPAPDTLHLATPSRVAFGSWSFTLSYDANLSNYNGARAFLISDQADLEGVVHGYFVQIGTNNSDEIRLYRQDGDPSERRVELAASQLPPLLADAGSIRVEVTRKADGHWSLSADGAEVLTALDDTYTTSDFFGVWVKHTAAAAQSYTFDDFDVHFDDVQAPALIYAEQVGTDTLDVYFDEAVDPGSVSTASLKIGSVPPAQMWALSDTVWRVVAPIEPQSGELSLRAEGVRDVAGNTISAQETVIARRPDPGDAVINEILFAPRADPDDNWPDQPEYVELYNRRPFTLALGGLHRTSEPDEEGDADTLRLAPRLVSLPPHGFAVIYADTAAFTDAENQSNLARAFPHANLTARSVTLIPVQRSSLSLRNTGDQIRLHRRDGVVLDGVAYDPDWQNPTMADATGIALERLSPDAPSNDPGNWDSSPNPYGGTPGAPNAASLPSAQAAPTARLSVEPSPFSPDRDGFDDVTTIGYELGQTSGSVRIRIYDAHGRLVRTITPGDLAAPTGAYVWDGYDDAGQPLRIGIYIVVLDAVYPRTGQTALYKAPVVLARHLN